METQLRLITKGTERHAGPRVWRLTEETCQIGRQGIAMARRELRRATLAAGLTEEQDADEDRGSRPSAA